MKNKNRRNFLKKTVAIPAMSAITGTSILEAADVDGDYKAVVCIVLGGGADSFNMVIPTDDTEHQEYTTARSGIAIPKEDILPLNNTNSNELNPSNFGLRKEMLKLNELFNTNKLAIMANVGTLKQPITLNDVDNPSLLPLQLFAHHTQRNQWMTGTSKSVQSKGIGAKIGDLFYPSGNPYVNIATQSDSTFQQGGLYESLIFTSANMPGTLMETYGFGVDSGGGDLGKVHKNIFLQNKNTNNRITNTFSERMLETFKIQEDLQSLFTKVARTEPEDFINSELGSQLRTVTEILSVKDDFPGAKKRQIFVVHMNGWDTHNSDNNTLCQALSDAMGYFYAQLEKAGIQEQVTTFTISEFGRKLTSNGKGPDHGWGTHCFAMGGAVKGGEIHGKMPMIKQNSPDAWSDRLIPTTSVEQYLSPIVKWFGATDSELSTMFENLDSFTPLDPNFIS